MHARMNHRTYLVLLLLFVIFYDIMESKDFHFKYYSYRKKQKHAKMYGGIERSCQQRSCAGLHGLEQIKCTRTCVSEKCYKELYSWDELEDGEIDVRFNSFKGCVAAELQNKEIRNS